jgi:5-methylthioadenosine/S-adenosylhomocysteine deaminase
MPKSTLIKGAQIVTMDAALGDFASADILVKDGVIAAVGPSLAAPDAETIAAAGMIALPGIIDAHTCLWQTVLRGSVPDLWAGTYGTKLLPWRRGYTAEDNYNAAYVGAFEALSYGTTTIVDYCHNIRGPGYADASIKALRESGIRHLFEHSFMSPPGDTFGTLDERLAEGKRVYETFHDPKSLTCIGFGVDSTFRASLPSRAATRRRAASTSTRRVPSTS